MGTVLKIPCPNLENNHMKINLPKTLQVGEKLTTVPRRGGIVTGNIRTERVFIDINGNEINPRTKQIIKRNVEEKLILPN